MIVIRVELWPDGDARKASILGIGTIINDLSGTSQKGNYDVKFYTKDNGLIKEGRVEKYSRLKGDIWGIIKAALIKSKRARTFTDLIYNELEKGLEPDKNSPP